MSNGRKEEGLRHPKETKRVIRTQLGALFGNSTFPPFATERLPRGKSDIFRAHSEQNIR